MSKYIDLPKINPVTHVEDPRLPHNKWCGPAAVSILTGMPAELAAEWIRIRRGKSGTTKGIRGTSYSEVTSALAAAGCRIWTCGFEPNKTLTHWLKRRNRKATYLVEAGDHYIVVRGNKACCGKVGEVVSVRKIPGRRARVNRVWRIQKLSGYKFKDLALPTRHKKVWDEKKQHWKLQA